MSTRISLICWVTLVLLSTIAVTNESLAATVTVATGTYIPGQTEVALPVSLDSAAGEEVCAAQFDLLFNSSVLTMQGVTAGSAATAAGKQLSSSTISPGRIRVIVAGLNQNVIGDGVIATVRFAVVSGTPGGIQPVTLSGVLLSDPDGVAVPSSGVSGGINIPTTVPTNSHGLPGVAAAVAAFCLLAALLGGARIWRARSQQR